MVLRTGTRLGAYEITGPLGAGGMGEVYRARDTRLDRDVALKILPAAFASDPDRLMRFEREAKTLAALNHPHIAQIYGLEEGAASAAPIGRTDRLRQGSSESADASAEAEVASSVRALVMELVPGETLSDRLAHGPIALEDALPIARQIAEALEAAHEAGIIHRDLKPANIKVRADGTVKVLDFGLAKALEPPSAVAVRPGSRVQDAATITSPAVTMQGVILGTAAYMSPEQAKGKPVDRRADIWAYGCVLYEMLAARRAFEGEDITDTIVAIASREPDWSRLPATTPAAVRRLLRRCFEKDPRRRLRDIGDARLELDDARVGPRDEEAAARLQQPSRRLLVALLAAVITLGGVTGWLLLDAGQSRAPEFSRIVRLTSGADKEAAPAISPDGKWVAYVSNAGGAANVWVKFLGGASTVNLTAATDLEISSGTGIGGLDIAPDGSRIAVMARPRGSVAPFSTWELPAPLPGGVPRKLLSENLLGMRWSPDGRRITFIAAGSAAGDALYVADADGAHRTRLIEAQNGMHVHWPTWGADGYIYFIRTFATIVNLDTSEIYRIHADGGRPMEPVVQTLRRAQFPLPLAPPGALIYSANPDTAEMRLWWSRLDGRERRQLISGVGEYSEPRVSADGRTLVGTLYEQRQALTRIALDGGATPVTDGFQGDLDPMLAPGGDRIAFSSSRAGNRHVWTVRSDGSDARPLTSGPFEDHRPVLSPDGRQIAFGSDRGGASAIWVVPADGGPPRKVVDVVLTGGITWSRDGQTLVYSSGVGDGSGLWKVDVAGGVPQQIPTPFFAAEPAWSPTADVIAYMSIRRINDVAFTKVGFVDPNGRELHPELPDPPGGNGFSNGMVAWSPDGRRVAAVQQQSNSALRIWIVDPEAPQPYTQVREFPPGPRIRGLTWTRDGRALIAGVHDWTSDIVLATRD